MLNNSISDILRQYEALRDNADLDLQIRKEEIYSKIPRIKEIDEEISTIGLEAVKSILKGIKNPDFIKELEEKSSSLKKEKELLLSKGSYPADYLFIRYKCSACKDTGFIDNRKCSCLIQKLIENAYDESNLSSLLQEQNFDTFNFEFYSNKSNDDFDSTPLENMQNNYKYCLNFAYSFARPDKSLLFIGAPGLGKTFLSSCIAKEVLDKGYTVFYQTAFKIFDILEEYKFSKEKGSFLKSKVNLLFDADLLIIDDLGTEFVNSYTNSEFFNILNSRLLSNKKTIISTNLQLNELSNLYSERVFSRIMGNYKVLKFYGDDIRIKKII